MGRRRSKRDRQSASGNLQPDNISPPQVDDEFLDAFLEVGAELHAAPVEAAGLPIRDIMPDPVQPRRAMPAELRDDWLSGIVIDEVLDAWETAALAAAIDARMPLRWKHIIDQEDDPTPLNERGDDKKEHVLPPVAAHWMELVRLAGSIRQVGLEQPITVYPDGRGYRLIVGERRLLAFHLLDRMGYDGYAHIPALKRSEPGVWRQAFENGAREDLNAIAKTRQLGLLLMALNPGQWEPFDDTGQPDQEWYAQAYQLRVPYGRAEAVTTVLGLKNPRQLRLYRALLALPELVWELADEHDWPEGRLRAMVKAAKGDSDQLIRIAREEAGLDPRIRPRQDPLAQSAAKVVNQLETVSQLKPNKDWTYQHREAVKRAIKEARRRLDSLEQEL